ncbi:Alpha/Beta hydrolase protein [Cokeromyces recurvatus]|uniref:Alpha/Beta hydrolase protein n=1 Tax=Cokeromyces recurvatus TaxID=90255 RepID=UPI00221E88C5|nr:Alpha/Beta hydrolase protein [Cokeromyces recurvatus]KAI7901115.1 Alpha/Beta hydrolase protein [Cokeromyces recurvatus]
MFLMTNSLITGGTAIFGVIFIAAFSVYYLYHDRRFSLSERFYFLICKRNIEEALLEHELLKQPEPDIIANNTQYIEINGHKLRIVHIIHELGSKVPLIVFIHGLGGQVSQWKCQIEYFSHTAHVLAIDLLGCGKSEVTKDWESYTTASLVEDVKLLLLERYQYPSTVIIAHSYGCSIASFVASSPEIQSSLKGLILIAPKDHIKDTQKRNQKKLRWIPNWIFNCARTADRKGGLYSKSVDRFLGTELTDLEIRKSQLRWNLQSKTPVYKRYVRGASFPSRTIYEKIKIGVLLIGGGQDRVTPPTEMNIIRNHLLGLDPDENQWDNVSQLDNIRVPVPYVIPDVGHVPMVVYPELVNPVISDFLIKNCGLNTLSGAWQILHKTKGENKWDLKNYAKWAGVANITETPIGPSLFRAMKVMRQTDSSHCPSALLAKYPEIRFIIDISNDTPPYRASDFEHSRIEYIKFKTVSKIPPTREEVAKFIEIASSCWTKIPDAQIAVHCHYGFNRTGFFICCFMIEKLGVSVPDALRYFKEVRPPGIRHAHFIDELYLRYVLNQR